MITDENKKLAQCGEEARKIKCCRESTELHSRKKQSWKNI